MKYLALILITFISFSSYSQKPKKTHDHEAFIKKVKMSFVPELIGKWMPNEDALKYVSEKTGRSLDELTEENNLNTENVKENIKYFLDNNIAFIVDKTELKVKEESPVKIADILMYCRLKDNKFTIKFSNCIQTNISWFLGNEVVPEGDGFDNFITYNKNKKPSKFEEKLKEIEDKQKANEEKNKKFTAYKDSLRKVRPGYEADLFPMKMTDKSTKYYKFDLTDMPLEGYYIKNNGQVVNAVIAYQKPEFLVGDFASASSLFICKSSNGKKVDVLNPGQEPNFKEFIKKDQIRAFFVGGQLYSNITGTGWRIVISEGAVHTFAAIVKVEGGKYLAFEQTQKLYEEPLGSVLLGVTTNVKLDMMEDCPEIVQDYKDGKYPIHETEIRYNIWFDMMYPGKVKYLPVPKN